MRNAGDRWFPLEGLRTGICSFGRYLHVLMLAFFVAGSFPTGTCGADGETGRGVDSPDGLAGQYTILLEEKTRLLAEIEFLKKEAEVTSDANDIRLLVDAKKLDHQSQQLSAGILHQHLARLAQEVTRLETGMKLPLGELRADLEKVHRKLLSERRELLETSARKEFTGQLSMLVNVDNRWLWLCGVIAVGTLIGVYAYDQRHRFRRLLWVRKTRAWAIVLGVGLALAIPLLPTLLTFILGNQTYEALLALPHEDLIGLPEDGETSIKGLQADIVPLREEQQSLLVKQRTFRTKRTEQLAAAFPDDSRLAAEWTKSRDQLQAAYVNHAVQRDLAAALSSDLEAIEKINERWGNEKKDVEANSRVKRLTAAALGGGLLMCTLVGGGLFRRAKMKRQKQVASTCPRCLGEGKLVSELPAAGAFSSGLELTELRCTNVLSENPYEECGFTFNVQYRDRIKMSFPTLGVASSGKTHWLAMVYRELNQGRHPDNVHFERVRSRGSDEFDRFVDMILGSRLNTTGTLANELPHPIVFNFRDNDPLAHSHVLLNIFDFAGQIAVSRDIYDSHRQRQLRSDGFFFFLDPTYASEKQAEALIKFREEVKLIKRLGPGEQIHVPVALCVTKIDLLVNQSYSQGGDVVNAFYKDLDEVDRKYPPMSLELIAARSKLMQELRDQIWPNWEIEKQVKGLFGERFMFFPLTPVGLDQPGEEDLTKRNIQPYGIIEPLMWLLHMNGHPVF